MTKRERAIIMAYTGGVTCTGDDIGYFLGYVKEKTGIELDVVGWSNDIPVIDFGSDEKEVKETVEKIRSACKEDFEDLIRSSNEEENKKSEKDKNSKLFFKKLKRLQQILGRELRPDETLLLAIFESLEIAKGDDGKENVIFAGSSAKVSISLRACIDAPNPKEKSKDKDAERFANKTIALEKILGRELRFDEVILLARFDRVDEKKEEMPTKTDSILESMDKCSKGIRWKPFETIDEEKRPKTRDIHKPEPKKTAEQKHVQNAIQNAITESDKKFLMIMMMEIFLGRKLTFEEFMTVMLIDDVGADKEELEKESKNYLLKHMSECCCDKKENKND